MASLLLRLFHSDYFSPHLALSYLRTYSDNIGITYYLVSQLESAFPSDQVEFYWPQLCHLLITKPSESRALECFILRRCNQSVHVALLTLCASASSLKIPSPIPIRSTHLVPLPPPLLPRMLLALTTRICYIRASEASS
ncbi:hypothetical protein [Sporisorium scitamineum]|uniref:PIK helical domain-containing protein n=1 Tax=Sporisorium scitamineum TaxID=49012 RepID=A0A0F7S9F3_9BASI|nr:hypothetical protein [Sporisorium scitamineum]